MKTIRKIESRSLILSQNPEAPDETVVMLALERRLGRLHARQRLGIEREHEARVFGGGINFFHPENWYASHSLIAGALMVCGLYWRGRRNAGNVQLRTNMIEAARIPAAFDGFRILHLSDLHADTNESAMSRVCELLGGLEYDLCVLTGDYRGATSGPFEATLRGLEPIARALRGTAYAVLGNHDSILMVPGLEAMGVRVLLNEAAQIVRGNDRIHVVGIDDAHYFRVDNIEKAAGEIAASEFSILLSHTPEVYRQAAHAGFDVMLCGHTHGGQICLPGAIPITLDSVLPRRLGAGAWRYQGMTGYTSVGAGTSIVPVRINCPPEITLHILRRAAGSAQ
ncbi:MAG TPA: metallophosphoesterase [Rhizomicrobium sp.]|nr:metallophosphoesterase [Rhizomicrobium sp.]